MSLVSRLAFLPAALAAGALLPALAQDGGAPGAFSWRADLTLARAEAAQSGKPLLAVFR
ncbi:MAG: hypothetical protein L0216_20385 [Planctomycetales bacterium]|nr:hypothetical protein [Planctomycetales bacterium]